MSKNPDGTGSITTNSNVFNILQGKLNQFLIRIADELLQRLELLNIDFRNLMPPEKDNLAQHIEAITFFYPMFAHLKPAKGVGSVLRKMS